MAENQSFAEYFPPAGYNFGVSLYGMDGPDSMWQEISGLEVEHEVEPITEGGINGHVYRLPTRVKFQNLVLKRGLMASGSPMSMWVQSILLNNLADLIVPLDLSVSLYDDHGSEVMGWTFIRAYPVKWKISDFNAQENKIVTETIEFAYQFFKSSLPI
ncbi:MAG: phage tail protein [Bacteroidota bacterium]